MGARRILAGALAAPLILLTACGGDSSVADPPISSAPTSTAPTQPPKRESPKAFIRRWANEDTRIQQTGKTARFRQMSAGCAGCIRLANLVERIYSNGGFIQTKGWQITRISSAGSRRFDLYVVAGATTYAESRGAPVKRLPRGPAHFQLRLSPTRTSWNVDYLVQVTS